MPDRSLDLFKVGPIRVEPARRCARQYHETVINVEVVGPTILYGLPVCQSPVGRETVTDYALNVIVRDDFSCRVVRIRVQRYQVSHYLFAGLPIVNLPLPALVTESTPVPCTSAVAHPTRCALARVSRASSSVRPRPIREGITRCVLAVSVAIFVFFSLSLDKKRPGSSSIRVSLQEKATRVARPDPLATYS